MFKESTDDNSLSHEISITLQSRPETSPTSDPPSTQNQKYSSAEQPAKAPEAIMSFASHELKSPLTVIRGNLQLAERRLKYVLDNGEIELDDLSKLNVAAELVARASSQATILSRMITDLIDISRYYAHQSLQLHPRTHDLKRIVHSIVREQRKLHPHRLIHLEMCCEESLPVVADADRIGQVIMHYLKNALNHSALDQVVEVYLEKSRDEALLWVRDTGPGLSPAKLEHVWDGFISLGDHELQDGAITSLSFGLQVSRMIIERHYGQVGVQSEPGNGSIFWFTLPLLRSV